MLEEKKVLIISYYWGTRVPGMMKYLPEYGWRPYLLTADVPWNMQAPADMQIVKTHYRNALGRWGRLFGIDTGKNAGQQVRSRLGGNRPVIDSFIRLASQVVNYPGPDKNWKPYAVEKGSELVRDEKIDSIISSSPPITAHLIAKELKTKLGIPWVADLRDLWSQNHNYSYGPVRKLLDRKLERRTLGFADALVTTSKPWSDKLGSLHAGGQVHTVTNGFDPELTNDPPAGLTEKFTITYTGAVYRSKQSPWKLLSALSELTGEGTLDPGDIEVRFYGDYLDWLQSEINHYGLENIVRQYGKVDQRTAVLKQRESQLLLLLDWDDPGERGVYTLKIFEYFGTRRPILAVGGSAGNVVGEILSETQAGVHAPEPGDVKTALSKLYSEYKNNGRLNFSGADKQLDQYSHSEMARQFSDILNMLT